MLDNGGKGFYCGVPVLWKIQETNNQVILTGPFGSGQKKESLTLRYDLQKKEFAFLDPNRAGETGTLQFVTNQIPDEFKSALQTLRYFDGTQESLVPQYTIFANVRSEPKNDLEKLKAAIRQQHFVCDDNGSEVGPALLVDLRNLDLVKEVATNAIVKDSLTVRIRRDKEGEIWEVWENGKNVREEPYKKP